MREATAAASVFVARRSGLKPDVVVVWFVVNITVLKGDEDGVGLEDVEDVVEEGEVELSLGTVDARVLYSAVAREGASRVCWLNIR